MEIVQLAIHYPRLIIIIIIIVIVIVIGRAIVAGTTASRPQGTRMTGPARTTGAFVIPIKGMSPVVPCRQPTAGTVAGRTIGSQDTGVVARLSMAGRAIRGRTLVDPVPMT